MKPDELYRQTNRYNYNLLEKESKQMEERTVTITLDEYRELVAFKQKMAMIKLAMENTLADKILAYTSEINEASLGWLWIPQKEE